MMAVTPPPSKADKFGTGWGNDPIYLVYSSTAKLCAAKVLATIEIRQPCMGKERVETPLFVNTQGDMIHRRERRRGACGTQAHRRHT